MEKVLVTLREILQSGSGQNAGTQLPRPRLVCVFGCGGERDRGKRPLMGEVATRLSDEVIITSDNPRRENPDAIIGEIALGYNRAIPYRKGPGGGDRTGRFIARAEAISY